MASPRDRKQYPLKPWQVASPGVLAALMEQERASGPVMRQAAMQPAMLNVADLDGDMEQSINDFGAPQMANELRSSFYRQVPPRDSYPLDRFSYRSRIHPSETPPDPGLPVLSDFASPASPSDNRLTPIQIAKETIRSNPQWGPNEVASVMNVAQKAAMLQGVSERGGPKDPSAGPDRAIASRNIPFVIAEEYFADNPGLTESQMAGVMEAARRASRLQEGAERKPAVAPNAGNPNPRPQDTNTVGMGQKALDMTAFDRALANFDTTDMQGPMPDNFLVGTMGGKTYAVPRGDTMDSLQDLAASEGKRFGRIAVEDENGFMPGEFEMFDAPAEDESLMGILGPGGAAAMEVQRQNPNAQVSMALDDSGTAKAAQVDLAPTVASPTGGADIEALMGSGMELDGATIDEKGNVSIRLKSPDKKEVVNKDLFSVMDDKAQNAQFGDESAMAWENLKAYASAPSNLTDEMLTEELLKAHGMGELLKPGLDEESLGVALQSALESGEISQGQVANLTYWWKIFQELRDATQADGT